MDENPREREVNVLLSTDQLIASAALTELYRTHGEAWLCSFQRRLATAIKNTVMEGIPVEEELALYQTMLEQLAIYIGTAMRADRQSPDQAPGNAMPKRDLRPGSPPV